SRRGFVAIHGAPTPAVPRAGFPASSLLPLRVAYRFPGRSPGEAPRRSEPADSPCRRRTSRGVARELLRPKPDPRRPPVRLLHVLDNIISELRAFDFRRALH